LVGDEQDVVLLAYALHLGPVALRWDDDAARALYRLADEGGDGVGAELENLVLDSLGSQLAERLRRRIAALTVPIGLPHVVEAGQRDAVQLMHGLHAAETGRGHGAAVIAVHAANDVHA